MLRINAPLASLAELEMMINSGANEVYCGVVPAEAQSKATGGFLNRRPTREGNLPSFAEVREAVVRAHDQGVRVSFTLNEPYAPEDHYPILLNQAEQAAEAGVDAIIVADPVLVSLIRSARIPVNIHISVAASCINSAAVSLFYSLGAKRIILPRHLRFAEVSSIVHGHPDLEFEVIVLGDPCAWDDGMCTMEHNLHLIRPERPFMGGLCSVGCQTIEVKDRAGIVDGDALRRRYLDQLHRHRGCALCALWDLQMMGIGYVKSTGRDNSLLRIHFVRYLYAALSLLEDNRSLSREVFVQLARDLRTRMLNDFVAGKVLELGGTIPSPTKMGMAVSDIISNARLLACDPPFGCYFPEAILDKANEMKYGSG